ncbi:MAG TPA: glycosyltransferase [Bacteroidales bacterium]|nr:glycosyltransferase [Bacteroidales bacterium]
MITVLTVHYNTPDLLDRLLSGFRRFYDLPCWVVDGSDQAHFEQIKGYADKYKVSIFHFDYNIHHGPGMAYGIQNIETDQIMLLDDDLIIHNGGFIEDLQSKLRPDCYGIGAVYMGNRKDNDTEGINYLHPACALINRNIALQYPLPSLYQSPMMAPMRYMHERGIMIIQDEQWVHDDFSGGPNENDDWYNGIHYVKHHWGGTLHRLGRGGV